MTSDDAFMVLVGVRYCLGRHSYAPSLCCGWLKGKWSTLAERDRRQIIREIAEHIVGVQEGRWHTVQAGWESDLRTWQAFHAWATQPPAVLNRVGGGGESGGEDG